MILVMLDYSQIFLYILAPQNFVAECFKEPF